VRLEGGPVGPTLSNTPSPATVTLSSSSSPVLADIAVLSGGTNPTGTLTFTLTGPSSIIPVDTETVAVNGNGTYTTPTGFTLPTTGTVAGTYQWTVSYLGDANNSPATGLASVLVQAASPAILNAPTPTTATLNGSVTTLKDSAVLSGYQPTGTLTFTLTGPGSTIVDTETVAVTGNGTYTTPTGFTLPATGAVTGTYQWAASYSGDGNNNAAISLASALVQAASPAISNTPTPASVALSSASSPTLKDSAVLSGGYQPTGTLTFVLMSPSSAIIDTEIVTVNGNGTYTTPTGFTLPTAGAVTGTYHWAVTYSGDGNNNATNSLSASALVQPASPGISTTPGGTVSLGLTQE
jgi:hypothetical protein